MTLPLPQIGHGERVFVASALHARYGGGNDDPVKGPTRMLLDEGEAAERARSVSRSVWPIRYAAAHCSFWTRFFVVRDERGIALELPPSGNLFAGEAVQRRLDALGRALALPAHSLRRRETGPAIAEPRGMDGRSL